MFTQEHIDIIKNGGVGVIPTDTLYGLVCSANKSDAVERLIEIKGVKKDRKGFVVLISSFDDLRQFDINLNEKQESILSKIWPGPFSAVFDIDNQHANILHYKADPFRIPNDDELREFIRKTGPLVAPSANLTNHPHSETIETAKEYFGEKVDFYVDGGRLDGEPSTIIMIDGDKVEIIREGAGDINLLN